MNIDKGDIVYHELLELNFRVTAIGFNIIKGIINNKRIVEGKKDDIKLIAKGVG